MRNVLQEVRLQGASEGGGKPVFEQAAQETLDCLDKHSLAAEAESEAKQKELEGAVDPIGLQASRLLSATFFAHLCTHLSGVKGICNHQ